MRHEEYTCRMSLRVTNSFIRAFYTVVPLSGDSVPGTRMLYGWNELKMFLNDYYTLRFEEGFEHIENWDEPMPDRNCCDAIYYMLILLRKLRYIQDDPILLFDPKLQPNLAKPRKKKSDERKCDKGT